MASLRLWLFVFISSLTVASGQLDIELKQNGYRNLLIAISDTVAYDANLVPRIKEVFNDASATMFKATGFRAYFKDVTILVPTSWNFPGAKPATIQSFDKAHIRVDNPSSNYGDNPWVRQSGGCGVPGEFMHITPKFLLDKANSVRKWGPLEKVLVHEWGHLRWGLFDEYPIGDAITEHFYQSPSTKKIEPSRCNINVVGRMRHRMTGADCKVDPATSLPESNCRFYPNRAQTKALSSLMYFHFLPSVESYCDDDDLGAKTVHNYEAPSRHNRLCSGKSSWEIMRNSPDFKNGNNEAADKPNQNTNVTFNVVQRRESKVVVVMDISGSMEINDYYLKMNAAVTRYLRYTVPTGASVGLVKYSTTATALTSGLIKINSASDRQKLVNLVPLEKKGSTAIGRGLLRAKQMLEKSTAAPADIKGSRIILLTDGEENVNPKVASIQPQLFSAGLTIDTILLTPQASNVLISLAAQTGGLSFYSSGSNDSTSLNDAFTESERSRVSDSRDLPITIESRVVTVKAKENQCYSVIIDKNLGRHTTFTFSWVTNTTDISIEISNADEKHQARVESTNRAAAFKCEGQCKTGSWRVCIKNSQSSAENIVSQVESTAKQATPADPTTPSEDLLPITVKPLIVNKEPDFNNTRNYKPVSLFASVTRGYAPVVGAMVVANIEYPSSDKNNTRIMMRDDGAGADIAKGDGTYSAYIVNSAVKGKHTISIEVNSDSKTSVKTVTVSQSRAGAISEPGEPIATQEVKFTPTDKFQRFSPAGYIDVKSVAPANRDLSPPSRIIDLEVTEASYDDGKITLEWTAVGDDLDEGSASSYELWTADSHKTMYRNRTGGATKIPASRVVEGNLSSPLPAYSKEKLVINVPDKDTTAVYALIAEDDANNPSELSNVVSAKLVKVPKESPKVDSTNIGLIVGIVVGVVAFIVVMVAVVVVVMRKRGRSSIV